jgi:L-cystine uptake protein TcyP (sodium:dicarboxylate symporter family)
VVSSVGGGVSVLAGGVSGWVGWLVVSGVFAGVSCCGGGLTVAAFCVVFLGVVLLTLLVAVEAVLGVGVVTCCVEPVLSAGATRAEDVASPSVNIVVSP